MVVAVVTGGGSGIGLAVARRLACSPRVTHVAVLGRTLDRLHAAIGDVEAAGARAPLSAHACDVGDADQVRAALADVRASAHGAPVSVLVNAAGVSRDSLLVRASDDDIHGTVRTNLVGTMLMSRGVVKDMVRARGGSILCIGSVVGSTGNAGQSVYAGSKAGLRGFARSLAAELASRGVRVNVLEPGFVATAMTDHLDEKALAKAVPLGRLGDVEEVAAMAELLAVPGHDATSYLTGQVIRLDGGLSLLSALP